MEVGHSRLLKFFKEGRHNKPEMAEAPEIPVIKIQNDYQNPPNVEAEVPGTHEIREYDDKNNSTDTKIKGSEDDTNNSTEIKITGAKFTLSPVITVTKNETTLTKGDMKLQKVTVTEDIAEEESENGGFRILPEVESLTDMDRQTDSISEEISETRERDTEKMEGEEKSQDEKKSKIPMLRLRQAVERVKKERQAQKERGAKPRRSSIPKLKDAKKAVKRDTSLNFQPAVDDEFDKLYEEIVDNKHKNIEEKLPSVTMEDPEKIETKFEEIIHAYDEDEHEKHSVGRVSKIPALKRKDEDGASRITALIDRAKEKSVKTESKLKDGGFKVTATSIRTKRFSRGSRDLSGEEHQMEVTETIDIKESGDNDVFVKETAKTAPPKPERTFRNLSKRVVADQKASTVETKENIEDSSSQSIVTESLDKKDGTQNKTKRFTRTVSRETRERNLNRELSKNLKNIRREFRDKIEDARLDPEFKDDENHIIETTVTENAQTTPAKTERIVRGISREMNKDGQSNSNETVTVEELDDGGTRTITTKTTESLIIGTPVVTEKIIRNISREISTESQNNSIKGVRTGEETTDGGSKKVIQETYVRENAKGIPVKTERFTRGISREMGNINLRGSREYIKAAENAIPDDNKQVLKKETMKTEQIEREGIKVGVPVFTKITRSFSKGRIQNVEMSRTIEWKPADEVKTKNYSRSVSEKVTKKELKDADKWKYEAPIVISEVTEVNNKLAEQPDITPRDPVIESKINDTVKDIASKITTRKVTEFKSEEQVSNVEKTTFTLSSSVDLNFDSDFKASREIGTQMSMEGTTSNRDYKFIKEIGTQMSVEPKYLDSPFDRDFKLAKERSFERRSVVSSIDGDLTGSKEFGDSNVTREFGTQMSVVGKIVDRDFKVSKEIGTQMSLEGTKHVANSVVNEKNETEYSNLPTQEKDSDVIEVTVLKGNVSRIKNKIAKETVVISKKEPDAEIPKKKSVLSKIALFERLEPNEPYPTTEVPTRKIKCKYVPPNLSRTNSADRPKIVDELLKDQTQIEPLQETSKVEIGSNYDEVTYRSEPVVVRKSWRTAVDYGQNVSDIEQTNAETNEPTSLYQQQEIKDFETPQILPETIDFRTQESQIEFAKSVDDKAQIQREPSVIEMPTIFPSRINYEADIGKTKPGKINLNSWSSQVEINKSSVDKIDLLREESIKDIAQTLPEKVDFKTNGSHISVSNDLPENTELKGDDNQIYGDTIVPWKIDFNSEEGKFEVTQTLVGTIDSKSDDIQVGVGDNVPDTTHGYLVNDATPLPGIIDFKSYEIQTEIATSGELNSTQTEISKTLTGEIGYTPAENPNEHPKVITDKDSIKPEARKKEVSAKPKPGKLNLSLWQSKVEVNKTLVGKSDIKKTKDAEIAKALSGRSSFKNFNRRAKATEPVQGNTVLDKSQYKMLSNAEISKTSTDRIHPIGEANILPSKIDLDVTENNVDAAKPLLGFIDFNSNDTQVEAVRTLPETVNFSIASSQTEGATGNTGEIDFSSSENQIEEPTNLLGRIELGTEFVANDSKAEVSETLQDNIYLSSIEHQTDGFTTLSKQTSVERVGKLDLKAWEHQVEVNKTLVDKIDVVKGEHLEEIANTLPGIINFISYETQVGEARMFQAPIDLYTDQNKVEITEIDIDTEADENKIEIAKILPEPIELDPFKYTPRFNPLPMLIRLNSQENKDLKDNVTKVEISIELDPRETLSDPELVDEDPVVAKLKKDSTIANIKRKLTFITNNGSGRSYTKTPDNTPVPAETDAADNISEKRVNEIFNSIYDLGQESNETETWSFISSATANTYEIKAETIQQSNTYNVTADENQNTAQTEYDLDFDTYKGQSKLTKTQRSEADDFITSIGDYKQYKNVTNEYGFNFDIPSVRNRLTSSAYGADDFKTSTEELKRAKSLAELDLGDVVNGQVKRIVGRIKSVEFSRRESVKTEINIKEMPKKMSVLEKIALFESKTARARYESTTIKTSATKTTTAPVISEEVYLKKIEELTTGKTKFGRLEDMLYLPLADGTEIPILALGTALVDPRLLPHMIGAGIDMGYRAIDTAYIYGNEKEIGQAIKAKIDDGTVKREDLYIISKLWSTFHRSDLVESACKTSLENMGLDYFDLYLIHNPMSFKEGGDSIPKIATVLQYSQSDYLDAWYGMEGLVTKRLVKSIGVSNFNSLQIQRILDKGRLKPVVNQVECHPYLSQQRLHAFCAERNITLSCFGVLGSKGTPSEYKSSTTPVIDDALVKVMASGLNVSPAQLLIRYQIENGHNVVVKSSSAAHLWDNLQALTFKLDQLQIDALNALNKNKRTFTFKGMGDTHKNYPFLATY